MGLAPPTPYQWQVGDIGSAALLNQQLYNGLTFLLGPPLFFGVQATVQSIGNTANTAITLDTNVVDTYNGHSTTTNTSRYTVQQAGYYDVCGCVGYQGNSTGVRSAKIYYNGSVIQGGATEVPAVVSGNGVTISTPVVNKYCNVGDYLEVYTWQNSGGGLNTTAFGDQACSMWVRFSHN